MKYRRDEVGFVRVHGGVDLVEGTHAVGVDPGHIGVDTNGLLLTNTPGNVLIDLGPGPGLIIIRGIIVLEKSSNRQMLSGPVTIAATSGDPENTYLQFAHLDESVDPGNRFHGSHGLAVTVDSLMLPRQFFWRSKLDGGAGAWLAPSWG